MKFSKTYCELYPIKMNVRKNACWQDDISEPSEDYPLGGSLEPYDIERDKELTK